jgi:esterase/lipase superfamily enzyme
MRWLIILVTFSLVACSDRTAAPIVPAALEIGGNHTVLVGTTRALDDNGRFGIGRSAQLQFVELDISIPPNRETGTISDGLKRPNPNKDFVIADQNSFESPTDFKRRLVQTFSNNPQSNRDVVLYVHGFNNSFSDAVFRIAQLSIDLELPATSVAYAWPSRGHILGYEYDTDSALFARDGLQELITTIKEGGADRITVVAHSLGSSLLMEAMRQIELIKPGWTKQNLSGVILFSPDLNTEVFRSQTNAFKELPQPFIIFSSQADKFLKVSARLRLENERLGSLSDTEEFADLPIDFVDVTAFTDGTAGNHFVVGSSSTLISLLRTAPRLDESFASGKDGSIFSLPGQRRVIRNATQIVIPRGDER